jgi:hypothetical protein
MKSDHLDEGNIFDLRLLVNLEHCRSVFCNKSSQVATVMVDTWKKMLSRAVCSIRYLGTLNALAMEFLQHKARTNATQNIVPITGH